MNQNIYLDLRRRGMPYFLALLAGLILLAGLAPVQAAQSMAVVITEPQPGATVHDNSGAVTVAVAVAGAALSAENRLRVLMDGKPHGGDQRTKAFTLQGVERGEHTLQVQLLDGKGGVLATSPPVTFYLWQASRQFPARQRDGQK